MHRYYYVRLFCLLLIGFLLLTAGQAFAQAPRTMSFQGLLTNPDGSKLADGAVSLDIMLYDVETGGAAVWTESQQTTVANGVFSVILGNTTPLSAAFDKPYWVGIKINGESELVPRIPLTASPYSLGAVAIVSEPVAGTTFAVTDSSGTAKSTITSSGNMWTAGQATFDGGVVVGDSTSSEPAGKTSESAGQTEVGAEIGTGVYGISAWSTSAGRPAMHARNDSGIAFVARSKTGDGIEATSTSGRGIIGRSESGIGVKGSSFSNDGIYGVSMTGWAGHFGPGNVHIENRLKIDDIPSSTSTNYLVSDGGWVKFTTVAPGGSSFSGVLTNTPLIITNSAGEDVVTFNSSGTSNQNGHATFGDGVESTSTDKKAISGVSTNTYGVYGKSTEDSGVFGESDGFPGVAGESLNSRGVQGISQFGAGVFGRSFDGDGVYGTSSNGPWAMHAGSGNVRIENRLKIEDIPSSTSTSYLVSDGGWVKFTTVAPGSGFEGGTTTNNIKLQGPLGDITVDLNPNGDVSANGSMTVGQDITVPTSGGGSVKIDGTGSNTRIGLTDASGSTLWGLGSDGSEHTTSPVFISGTNNNDVIIGGNGTDKVIDVIDSGGTSVGSVDKDGGSSWNSVKVPESGGGSSNISATGFDVTKSDNTKAWTAGVDGFSIPLANGNVLSISSTEGMVILNSSGSPVAQFYPDGRLFASGVSFLFNDVSVSGDLTVSGTLSKAAGSFKIDDPIDPLNKYLSHSFVESPDMMNIYNGNIVLDGNGEALVEMPDWFEALNMDFRYQLTAIGKPGPNLYVASEMVDNSFAIAGGESGMKVSWQVTGIRHDAYANQHRIRVEEEKPAEERGKYMHPDSFK